MLTVRLQLEPVSVLLSGIAEGLEDLTSFWTDFVVPFVHAEADDVFISEGDGEWDGLDPRYAARKAVSHPGKGILRREDAYYDAATRPNAPGSLVRVSPSVLVVGVESDAFPGRYPERHESGTATLSARPVYRLIVSDPRFDVRLGQLGEKWQSESISSLDRF